ncbi:MAG: 4-hydroxy-3-methylbut-2-enyl diphosphate reductase [Spirochaetales bacterium]|nr:4-hydroxy-3-methylbut-2-enyl diphosphate reductase [Spirochaetales bacterium]
MNVIVPQLSGFCPGVKNAEKKIFEIKALYPDEPVYIYGYVINNRKYIEYLENQNVHTVEDITKLPLNAIVVIRTHGINQHEEILLRKEHRVIDLTCSKVKRVQRQIQQYSQQNYFIVLTGKKDHPETKGLVSYAQNYMVIENTEDLSEFLLSGESIIDKSRSHNIFVISQTTGSRELFSKAISEIRKRWDTRYDIKTADSICPVTDKKEREALALQKEAEISFVVGDKLSSNAKKLFRILSNGTTETYFIEDTASLQALGLPLSRYRNALVVSSASTPVFVEKNVCDYLASIPHSEGNIV